MVTEPDCHHIYRSRRSTASLDNDNNTSKFFSTIPLAITTSLPVHVNASFFLASDRRSIRHDAHDSDETNFNKWLLSKPLPEIYLQLLEEIVKDRGNNSRWWPESTLSNDDDDDDDALAENKDEALTTVLINNFYGTHLPSTQRKVCSPMFSKGTLSPPDAILYSSRLPSPIKDLLRYIRPGDIVRLPIPVRLRELGHLSSVSPEYVKTVILSNTNKSIPYIRELLHDDFQKVLSYLLSTTAHNLRGLPLLRLQDRRWGSFALQGEGDTKYIWNQPVPHGLFDASHFVAPGVLSPDLANSLVSAGLNVAHFDSQAVKSMVEDVLVTMIPSARSAWVTRFWGSYPDLPTGLLPAIQGLGLVPTVGGNFISLKKCKAERVLMSNSLDEEDLLALVQDFGIIVVAQDACPPNLKDILRSKEYVQTGIFFTQFLHAMKASPKAAILTIRGWPEERRKRFTTWFHLRISTRPSKELLPTIQKLPVWHAQKLRERAWMAATDIKRLPSPLNLDSARFVNVFVCTEPASIYLGVKQMSWELLGSCIEVPGSLTLEDEELYRPILYGLLTNFRSPHATVWLPDSTREMVRSDTLYARQPLFEAAFDGRPDKFLLPTFWDFESRLQGQNLIKHFDQLDMNMFRELASALHHDESPNKTSRAAILFRSYGEDLPLRVTPANRAQWTLVNDLQFIPRDTAATRQYNGLSLPLPRSIRDLPDVVSPNKVVRAKFERIAWTQRARFATQPNQRVLLANPELGKPSASEVIAHLRALTTMRQGEDVLKYLQETYAWLNDNASALNGLHGDIFLNVDDPAVDEWAFTSADQMAFENHDVQYIQRVRSFLMPYRALLEVAGVIKVKYPEVDTHRAPENTDESVLQMMRTGFAQLREDRIFTDVVFTSEEDRDEEDPPQFFAHRSFLSVFGGYFKDMFTGEFAEGREASAQNPLRPPPLPHSRFAIRIVLDYCYTGEVISPSEEDISYEDLLQSLELSHYLDIKSLFHNIQLEIIKRKLIDPLNLDEARARATRVEAEQLVLYCNRYAADNILYISRILQA
ncbi:hypothetical protein BKA70DRAFT_1432817 [Coprinopsis sp. MPI-PUGE-AT-0042]|nr:hypothetical protein BKA70DRAFT_1432817 [Coprinopsis sp. MPI-PUGE-AT-0042]